MGDGSLEGLDVGNVEGAKVGWLVGHEVGGNVVFLDDALDKVITNNKR